MVTEVPPSAGGVVDLPSVISGKSSLSITMAPLIWDRRVDQLAVGTRDTADFDGAERLDVEVNCRGRIVDDQVRGQRGLYIDRHSVLLSVVAARRTASGV